MKILYLSAHSILERDEVALFTELGHDVFSLGAYIRPETPGDDKRPPLKTSVNAEELIPFITSNDPQSNLSKALIDWCDIIIVMHRPDWITKNWENIKHKKVIWRTIGQSVASIEQELKRFRDEGLKIVRYSPCESGIPYFIGSDAMIRFYKDSEEFKGWTGGRPNVINVTQSMKQRGRVCGYGIFFEATEGLNRDVYGTSSVNPDGTPMDDPIWRGQLSFEDLKNAYRINDVYFYTGTYPASYTLNFIEAWMTGIPVVAVGSTLANLGVYQDQDAYEVPFLIENGVNGFVSDSIPELHAMCYNLLNDKELATRVGNAGRESAIKYFGKEKIKGEWDKFLNEL